ncbi:hypothetical protein ASD90_21610 [Terrabacter sp. Root181]|nr:hypothetical protein ASD90_21610 [Terrabacter sp. Root181]
MALASHCAIPLALTPDLAYRIWGTFPHDVDGQPIGAPWVAVPDLLLSPLCEQISEELYAMSAGVRQRLIDQLVADPRFGAERAAQVARLLSQHVRPALDSEDVDSRSYAQAQVWAAEAQVAPARAAADLALAIDGAARADRHEVLRLVSVVDHLSKPLEQQPDLLTFARAHGAAARGDVQKAEAALNTLVDDHGRLTVAGVTVSAPASVQVSSPPRTDEPLPWRVGRRVAIAVGANGWGGGAQLLYCERDAWSIHDVLTKVGYDVDVLVQSAATGPEMRARLDRARGLSPDDVVVFYYSGHGTRKGGELLLALNDFEKPEDMVPLTTIEDVLVSGGAGRIVLLLDTSGGQIEVNSVNAGASLANLRSSSSVSLLMPEVSYESSTSEQGTFTVHLVNGIEGAADANRDGVVTVEELVQFLTSEMNKSDLHGSGSEKLLFVLSGEPFAFVDRRPRTPRTPSFTIRVGKLRELMGNVARTPYKRTPVDLGLDAREVASLEDQLRGLAVEGARLHEELAAEGRLIEQVTPYRSTRIELGPSTPLIPLQTAYRRRIGIGPTKLCSEVRQALHDGIPIEATPCFEGHCPSLDDETVVCPSGFLGLSDVTTMSVGPLRPRMMMVFGAPQRLVWVDGKMDPTQATDPDVLSGSITELIARIQGTSPHVVWLHDVMPHSSLRALGESEITEPPSLLAVDQAGGVRSDRAPEKLLEEVSQLARHGLLYSEVPVEFTLAAEVRRLVLDQYLQGARADSALRYARMQLLRRGHAAGLAYGLIGAPSLSISQPP